MDLQIYYFFHKMTVDKTVHLTQKHGFHTVQKSCLYRKKIPLSQTNNLPKGM